MLVFIDESGDHNLDLLNSDNQYDVFVLVAICFKNQESYSNFDDEFKSLEKTFFGTDQFILHTSEITRPNKSKNELNLKFNKLSFRQEFYAAINNIIERTDFVVIPRAIDKTKFVDRYNDIAPDPYLFSFDYILNRIFFDTSRSSKIMIYPEARCPAENQRLITLYERLSKIGTKFISAKEIRNRITKFELISKSQNFSGLELADLIASPIGRHIIGKKPRLGHEVSYSVIEKKFRKGKLEIFP